MHFITCQIVSYNNYIESYVQYPLYFVSVSMFGMYGQMEEEDDSLKQMHKV